MGKKIGSKKQEAKAKPEKVVRETISKSDIIDSIADMHDLSKQAAKGIVDDVFQTIIDALNEDTNVAIDKFGSFKLTDRPERNGRNPSTGESIVIAARTAVAFKPSTTLKKSVNGE